MDSNGRQRSSLPGSSTFRRLPTLTRSPFRRADKTASPTPHEVLHDSRVSTFPSLARVVVDDTSLSSALFGSQIPSIAEDPHVPAAPVPAPRSQTSSPSVNPVDLSSPQLPIAANPNPSLYPQPTSPLAITKARAPMPTSALPNNHGFDLEPITYPAHLAQTRPPDASSPPVPSGSSTGDSPSSATPSISPAAPAPAVPARSAHRYREFTLGGGAAAFASSTNLTTATLAQTPVLAVNGTGGISSPAPPSSGAESSSPAAPAPSARRPSASSTATARKSSANRREKQDDTDSPDDTGKRRTDNRVRRPPKARERDENGEYEPLPPVLPTAKVNRAPASAMYFSPVAAHGRPPGQALRAHTGTLVGDRIWLLGGVDARSCWRGVASFDTESLQWSTVETHGEALPPLRAHTTTLVGDQLYIFGGGDGPTYSNDVWVFDTITHRFSRPAIATPRAALPPPRRAHTTVLYRNFLVVFGGGNGQAALNDVWALDVSDPNRLTWHEWRTRGDVPQKKGYHTANLVGDKMIVFGGSDGHASFADVHVLNLQTLTWTLVNTEVKHNRLSHTATQVGSYLFVIGGHNGQTYAQDVLLFNLVTLAWESKLPKGVPPPGRGYHVAVLHDARIFISGGYNGVSVFDDLWSLDLGAGAYLPQVTTFEVDETAEHLAPPPPTKNGPTRI